MLADAAAAAVLASAVLPPVLAACGGEVRGQSGGTLHWLPLGPTGSAWVRLGPTGPHWIKSCGVWGDAAAVAEQAAAVAAAAAEEEEEKEEEE